MRALLAQQRSTAEVLLGLLPLLVALTSVGFSLFSLRVSQRHQEEVRRKTKAEQVEELMSKYRDPLLRAAFDLQSRLYNIPRNDFLGKYYVRGTPSEREYALFSTLYVVGEFFGWVEIMRREVQFLDLLDVERDRILSERLLGISEAFLSEGPDTTLRVFRAEQRAIGELLTRQVTMGVQARLETHGYAAFVQKIKAEPEFAVWFEKLRADIDVLASATSGHEGRLVMLQHALIDLIDFLDPEFARFPRNRRGKMQPSPLEATAPLAVD